MDQRVEVWKGYGENKKGKEDGMERRGERMV
jgi:hypothetical protein